MAAKERMKTTGELHVEDRIALFDSPEERSLSKTLYGILQFESGAPTDDELKDMLADYLLKKDTDACND
ncbi:MAG: hypothetical protein WAM70_07170 [Pyrinomonadaceae bacterium]